MNPIATFEQLSRIACIGLACFALHGCGPPPSIEITEVPEAGPGGAARMERIAGRVAGAGRYHKVVIYAKSGTWWVQPFANKPFTDVQSDLTWKTSTHLGTEYAALLVDPSYQPPKTIDTLTGGDGILAIAKVEGRPSSSKPPPPPKRLRFSGYDWDVLQLPSDSGGVMHENSSENAWTDARGWLHLRIASESGSWACAEVILTRSLGYGEYSFVVHDMPPLEPASVLGMFTWDPLDAGQNHREIDVELSQWGDPRTKNAQFTIQPYYVAANVFRFNSPAARVTHSFRWEPGRVSFKTLQTQGQRVIAEHSFTSGVPSPGGEAVHINLYTYGKTRTPQQNQIEVVIEKFEHLP